MSGIRRVRTDEWQALRWRESVRRSAADEGRVAFVGERDGRLSATATGTFPVERLRALDDPTIAFYVSLGFRDTGHREKHVRLGPVIEMERPCRM